MKRISSLSDLLMEELADLLNAETQLIEALPKMVEASQSLTLKLALEAHLEVTKSHAERLQDIFTNSVQNPPRGTCKAIKGLIEDGEFIVNETENGPTRDAAIISVAQRVEHYEITEYQMACEHAIELGHTRIVELLNKTIDEERSMYLHLNELVQGIINAQAIDPNPKIESGGFYMPKGKFRRGGGKKKTKNTDVSRFIDEGNPNIQEPSEKEEKSEKNLQNPEEQGDLS